MSTETLAAPAAQQAEESSSVFILGQGESFSFHREPLTDPIVIKLLIAEVSPRCMTINGKDMNGPRLTQTIGPPPDPAAYQSARLRAQQKVVEMPRSQYRWTYTIPGICRFIMSEVTRGKKLGTAVRFEVDETYR